MVAPFLVGKNEGEHARLSASGSLIFMFGRLVAGCRPLAGLNVNWDLQGIRKWMLFFYRKKEELLSRSS